MGAHQYDCHRGTAAVSGASFIVILRLIDIYYRYGYHEEADRLSGKFIAMCFENFKKDGFLREKYNVVTGSSRLEGIDFGYSSNEIGFGWTNGVLLRLMSHKKSSQ